MSSTVQLIMLRILLVLILVLPAGLPAAQHLTCESVTAAKIDLVDSAPQIEGAGSHHERQNVSHDSADAPTSGCSGCDLACKVSCAAIALPLITAQSPLPPSGSDTRDALVANLRNAHQIPLLRPPAAFPA